MTTRYLPRNYSNKAQPTTLTVKMTPGTTVATVQSVATYPAAPFVLGVDRGTAKQEVMLCTGKATATNKFTVIRGWNTTTATTHTVGATVEHTSAAITFSQPNKVVSALTTKGDLFVQTASGTAATPTTIARLAVGSNGAVLTATSTASGGVAWKNPLPAGSGAIWFGSTPPTGWFFCNGTKKSKTTYANLFNALGGTNSPWGVTGNTFFLPDLRSRTLVGAGQGNGLSNRTLGPSSVGKETVTLTAAQMPSHTHAVTDPGHDHELKWTHSTTTSFFWGSGRATNRPTTRYLYTFRNTLSWGVDVWFWYTNPVTLSALTGISVGNTGTSGAHNNMPPFSVVQFIIKY